MTGAPPAPTIRRASAADEDGVFALAVDFATSFALDRERFRRSFAGLLDDPSCLLLVAEHEGAPVGYLLAFVHDTFFANGPVCWIEEVTVRPDERLGGTGRVLVAEAERWAEANGASLVALATRRADAFWQAVGYEPSASYLRKLLVQDGEA